MLMSERPSENDLDVYSLCGEYDAVNAPQFEADLLRFAEATSGTLTVDCTDLGFMDSTGIGALLRVEQALVGCEVSEEAIGAACASAAAGTEPPSDLNGSADYRRALAPVLTRRAVLAAAGG